MGPPLSYESQPRLGGELERRKRTCEPGLAACITGINLNKGDTSAQKGQKSLPPQGRKQKELVGIWRVTVTSSGSIQL
eukprot:1145510-Pelagomonas_calceolata.AAC.8